MANQVIATENTIVHDDVLNIDRQIIAGLPVPLDLIDAYTAKVGVDQAEKSQGEDARDDAPAEPEPEPEVEADAPAEPEPEPEVEADAPAEPAAEPVVEKAAPAKSGRRRS